MRRILQDEDRLAHEVMAYKIAIHNFTVDPSADGLDMPHDRAARMLDLYKLRREADDERHPMRADAASRMLAVAFVNFAFYVPREALAQGRFGDAERMLRLGREIHPEAPRACLWHAQALAQLGEIDKALDAARCAAAAPWTRQSLSTNPLLDPIRNDPRFQEITGTHDGSQ